MPRLQERNSFRSLRHRNFRLFFWAGLVSNVGSWAQMIAQDWLVLELTSSPLALSAVTFLQLMPTLVLSLPAGVIADRFSKRRILLATNSVMSIAAGITGILVLTEQVQLWHVFGLALVLGSAGAIDAPARIAFNTEMVGQSDLANAVSLNSTSFNIARLIGPAASGLLITQFGTGPSFLINAVSYGAVLLALGAIRERELHISERRQAGGSMMESWRYIWARPDLRAVLLAAFFTSSFGLNFNFFNAIMSTKVFDQNAAIFGTLGTVVAVGSLTGALLSTRLEHLRTPGNVLRGAVVFGAIIVAIALAPSLWVYAAILPFAGISALLTLIGANSCMQLHTDAGIRGRVMAWYVMAFNAPFGAPLLGWLAEWLGVRETIAGAGMITALSAVAIALTFKGRLGRPAAYDVESVLMAVRRV